MDKFTRNYSIVLGLVLLAMLVWLIYEDPQVSDLHDLLEANTEVASYPYQFKVLSLRNGIATMTTPRSRDFPVYRALGLLFPQLAGRAQDNPNVMKAQQELARIQKLAKAIVLASGKVKAVRWELDQNWLRQHGVEVSPRI